ncbi:hyaluronate lyase, partial [Paenibacillus sp. cl123]
MEEERFLLIGNNKFASALKFQRSKEEYELSKKIKRLGSMVTLTLMLLMSINSFFVNQASAADEFDDLRARWKEMITGGTAYNPLDPDIAGKITAITATANTHWSSMDKTPGTYLWSDLTSTTDSSQITTAYGRIKLMALAYATTGSSLHNSAALLADIKTALDWIYTNRYNESVTKYGNWWDWEIGVPLNLNDTVVMLYDNLSPAQITNYMTAVNKFQPSVSMTGANRAWECTIIAVRGIIVKDAAKMIAARDGLSPLFAYVNSGDGFYTDGSFIQHEKHPYNGGYGTALITDIGNLMYLLSGSTWAVTHTGKQNAYDWVYDSFEPLIYKGAMMDMSRGRNISRSYAQDHDTGVSAIKAIIRLSQSAPAADKAAFRSMVKYWINTNTYRDFFTYAPINMILLAKEIDANATSRGELIKHKQYPRMDQAVHLRPGFGFAVNMSSSRIYNYESINGENLKGWYTGDGMTYLYNNDISQYTDNFWPTVNPYRLPGTTEDTLTRSNSSGKSYLSSRSWVGGTSILGLYGISGMAADINDTNLTANKSWFMFDDEVVALGSGITTTGQTGNGWDGTPRKVETTVENRKLTSSGNNALTVNGTAKSTALGWSETMTGVNWVHLAGNAAGSDIGYYFPGGTTLKGLREARTGKWRDIDGRSSSSTAPITGNYATLWLDHGTNPTNADYSYVLLPGKTSAQVSSYAANPHITVLENSTNVQAVREKNLNITAANFWTSGHTAGIITSDSKASVMTKENAGSDIEVSVSDPTQVNTGSITIEIAKRAFGTISADAGITVSQLSPTIKFSVNVSGAKGKTFKAKFNLSPTLYEAEDLPTTASGAVQADFTDSQSSNGAGNKLDANGVNDYVEYSLDVPSSGT